MQSRHAILFNLIRFASVLALFCLTLITLALAMGVTLPSASIAFTRSEFANHYDRYDKLHVMDLRTGLQRKVSDQLVACCAVWSPDGTRIAYTSWQGQPFVWDIRDGITRALASPDVNATVGDWSPDSQAIVMSVYEDDQGYSLFRVQADGSQLTDLRTWPNDTYTIVYDADWSADGQFIVFAVSVNTVWEIGRIDPDGRHFQQLTSFGGNSFKPQISPDSQQIAFVSEQDENIELFTMRADGSDLRRLTWTDGNEGEPVWSPDGTRLLFQTYVNDDFPRVLDVMNTDGSERQRLVDYTTYNNVPSWSPDGSQILYEVQSRGSDLYVMDAAEGMSRLLVHDDFAPGLHSSWQP